MEKLKALVRHLVISLLVPQGRNETIVFLQSLLREVIEGVSNVS